MHLQKILVYCLALFFVVNGYSQQFETSIEAGTFTYLAGTVAIKPGPNWKGYYLPRHTGTGFQVSSVNGFAVTERTHLGIGVGYANFEGISGIRAFADMRFHMNDKMISPYFYFDPGFSHFWNQYPGGRSTFLLNAGFGARAKISNRSLRLSSGFLFMQQNMYVPVTVGVRM